MIEIPSIVKRIIQNEYTIKNHRIHFLDNDEGDNVEIDDIINDNIVYDTPSFGEAVCSQTAFAFGLSEASSFSVEVVNTPDRTIPNILDRKIAVSIEYKMTRDQANKVAEEEGQFKETEDTVMQSNKTYYTRELVDDYYVYTKFTGTSFESGTTYFETDTNIYERYDLDGYWYTIPYGIFYIEECARNHDNMTHRQITAYSRNERNFDLNLAGVYKEDSFAFQPDMLVDIALMGKDDMKPMINGRDPDDNRYGSIDNYGTSTLYDSSWNTNLWMNAGVSRKVFRRYFDPRGKVIVFRADYKPDDYDKEQALELLDVATKKLPTVKNSSGNKINFYYDNVNETTTRVFTSTEDSVRVRSGCFQPSIYFQLIDTNNDSAQAYTYPIFIKPNKNIVIDVAQLVPIYKTSKFKSATLCFAHVTIPFRWYSNDSGTPICWARSWSTTTHDDVYYPDFGADWPVDETHTREGYENITVHFKEFYKANYSDSYVAVKSTLETTKSSLGTYHIFSNSVSTTDLLGGYAEANAMFLKQNRDGTFSGVHLNNTDPVDFTDSNTVEHAWWDEYDVEDIGKIRYTYTNSSGDEVTTNYSVDSTKRSIYDMTDNYLLKNVILVPPTSISDPPDENTDISKNYRYTGATKTVEGMTWTKGNVYYYFDGGWHDAGKYNKHGTMVKIMLEKNFIPYISMMKFTPIEASFANVPYMEAGDAFRFTTKDNTEVSSYIMRQTISGSQKIISQIECVDGQIISREEEDDE